MTTDLEERLSELLHREAAQIVPDDRVPPLREASSRRWQRLVTGSQSRWRAPILAAVAVLAVALVTTAAVQLHRTGSAAPAAGASPVSPVLDRPAAAFECAGGPTRNAARAQGGLVIGVTDAMFCTSNPAFHTTGGSGMVDTGPLRSVLESEDVAAGLVDSSVTGVRWIPSGDESSAETVDLYRLGTLRGFVIPGSPGGTLVLYSGSTVVVRQLVPAPFEGLDTASSSPAPGVPASAAVDGSTRTQRSYPPGQGPSPKPGTWPTNARGQTYGSDAYANAQTGEPDLIAAYATNGKEGYVARTDLDGPVPTNVSQAIAQNSAPSRTIPVYLSDGITQIGVFVIGANSRVSVDTGAVTSSSVAAPTP